MSFRLPNGLDVLDICPKVFSVIEQVNVK